MWVYIYIYIYIYIQEHQGPSGLLFLWWPSASTGGFAPSQKSSQTPQDIQNIEKCKNKNLFFSPKFPKFCQSLFKNFVSEHFFENKKSYNPPKRRET